MRSACRWLPILSLYATPLAAQGAGEGGAFIVRLGKDTLAVERYTRTERQLRGDQVLRSPQSVHRIYTAILARDARLSASSSSPTTSPGRRDRRKRRRRPNSAATA